MKPKAINPINSLSPFFGATALVLTFVLAPIPIDTAQAQQSATEQEVYAIGVEAYLYFYSLVTMDITRKQLSNVEPGKGLGGPMNSFANVPEYPAADMKAVVRPNFDTLYSSGWLDLTKEPMIVSVPDTGGRFYLLPMLDMWTDVFSLAGLADDRYRGCKFRCRSARVATRFERSAHRGIQASERHPANRCPDSLRLDHRPYEDGRPAGLRRGSQDSDRLQDHVAFPVGQDTRPGPGQDRPDD
jgi:Protein of unknown function (DUF1254)